MSTITFTTLFEEYATNEEELMGFTNGIVAYAGGGLSGSTVLTTKFNIIGTCVNDNDSCQFPVAKIGERCFVWNPTAKIVDVYPNAVDTINGGTTTVISIPPNSGIYVEAYADQIWIYNPPTSAPPINVVKVSLTKAQILALTTTQIVAVAAPGAGYAHEVIGGSLKYIGGTSYYNGGNGDLIYTDTATTEQASSSITFSSTTSDFQKLILGNGTIIENKALVIKIIGTPFTDSGSGAGTMVIYLVYRTITL